MLNKALELRQVHKSKNLSDLRKSILGESHVDVASSLREIGYILASKGNYANAKEYYEKSLGIFIKTYNAEHPDVATLKGYIAWIHFKQGNYDQAESLYL